MKLNDGKLILNENELECVKRANFAASPTMAAMYLKKYLSSDGLVEGLEQEDARFFIECIQAYRRKNFEVK